MRKIPLGGLILAAILIAGPAIAAQCHTPPPAWWNAPRVSYTYSGGSSASFARVATHEFAAQRRPEITVYSRHSRHLRASAKRHCEARLVREYRVSGAVVVPRQTCWWQ